MDIIVDNINDTRRLAYGLSGLLRGNEIILLNGELGAGKTTFTKSLAEAIGVTDTVTSPTFAFMREYKGSVFDLYHYDMYRAESEDELFELGLSDNLELDGICVIEWNKLSQFPAHKEIIIIDIAKLEGNRRIFSISGIDERSANEFTDN